MEENNKRTRRKFLDKGLKLGLVSAIGGIGLAKLSSKLSANTKKESGENL